MLPKDKRLNFKIDFKRVASGEKLDTKYLKLFVKTEDSETSSGPRIGIAVSGKYFKKATERNRARRLVSAAFEALYPLLPQGINIVALPKASVTGVKSPDVLLDLEEGLGRAGILGYKDTRNKIS